MPSPVLETSGLTKYYGKVSGIGNITLSIDDGEIFGFIGHNGPWSTEAVVR